ncbi:hypothetical protein [Azohydromonas lata]|uniref:hypothetical protein n=1 Tax=Azohydromonas lata TaxID=45677 RepID=UPI00082D2752|nr:hypothetical protein [Azohydromonas lata]
MTTTPRAQAVMLVAWPSFLMAAVLEMLVFALVDPHDLLGAGAIPAELTPTGVYSLAFFLFWAVIAAAGALGHWLGTPPNAVDAGHMHGAHGH